MYARRSTAVVDRHRATASHVSVAVTLVMQGSMLEIVWDQTVLFQAKQDLLVCV